MLSMVASRVLNADQPHHGWSLLVLFVHHHFSTTTLAPRLRPQYLQCHPTTQPRAPHIYWGMWAQLPSPLLLTSKDAGPAAPLLPKGCGRCSLARRGIRGGRKMRRDGDEQRWVTKYEPQHLSWFIFAILLPISSLMPLMLPPERSDSPKQWWWGATQWRGVTGNGARVRWLRWRARQGGGGGDRRVRRRQAKRRSRRARR